MGDDLIDHPNGANPPRGALVFWSISSVPAGHVALSLGDGRVIHAWGSNKPKCVIISNLSTVTNYSGYTYRGWGPPIAGYKLATDGSTTPVTPTVTLQPNTNSNHPMTINDTSAVISHFVYISGASISSLSKLGIKLYDASGTYLASKYDTNIIDSGGYVDAWYSVGSGKEVNYALTPGTTYKYRFFIEVGGETYYSDYKSFKTTGTTPTYTVTYNANGGTGAPASQTKTHGVDLTLSSTTPTRSSASAGSYTVTLNANGGNCSASSLSAARTTTYTFKNWNTKADGTGVTYTPGQV